MITRGRMGAISSYHEIEFHRYLCWPALLLLLVQTVSDGVSGIGNLFSFKPGSFRVEIGTVKFVIVVKLYVGHLL